MMTANDYSLATLLTELNDVKTVIGIRNGQLFTKVHLKELAIQARGKAAYEKLMAKFGGFKDETLIAYRDQQEKELELRLEKQDKYHW